jgi:hypothetical protein
MGMFSVYRLAEWWGIRTVLQVSCQTINSIKSMACRRLCCFSGCNLQRDQFGGVHFARLRPSAYVYGAKPNSL